MFHFFNQEKIMNYRELVKNAGGVAYWDARRAVSNSPPTNSPLTPAWEDLMGNSYNVTLTNYLGTDGNFGSDSNSDGVADGWVKSGSPTGLSVSNNVQSFTPVAQYNGIRYAITPVTNNKYYACAFVKTTHANAIKLTLQDGGLPTTGGNIHTGSGNWEFLSVGIVTATSTTNGVVYCLENLTTGFSEVQMKQFHVINLTDAFGAGFEPTSKTWLDYYMQLYFANNGYFTTSNSIQYDNRAININMAGTTSSGVDVTTDPSRPAWVLDGTDDHFRLPNSTNLNIISYPIAVFGTFRINSGAGSGYIFSKNLDSSNNVQYGLNWQTSNYCAGLVGGTQQVTGTNNSVNIGTWYNVGFIYDGITVKLYVNGSLANTNLTPTAEAIPFTNRPNVAIGRREAGVYLKANLATVTVYAGAKCNERNILRAEKAISKVYIK